MGKQSQSRKKTETIQVRATPQEKHDLKERAAQFGVSVGELCRRTIFGAIPKSHADQTAITELAAMRADLGRLGGLLKGWLAGSFPQGSPTPTTHAEIVTLLRKIETAQGQVVEVVKKVSGRP